jgi:hypothetical protein
MGKFSKILEINRIMSSQYSKKQKKKNPTKSKAGKAYKNPNLLIIYS